MTLHVGFKCSGFFLCLCKDTFYSNFPQSYDVFDSCKAGVKDACNDLLLCSCSTNLQHIPYITGKCLYIPKENYTSGDHLATSYIKISNKREMETNKH